MATPIGTGVVTSIARRYIMPEVADNIYRSNVLWFRLNAQAKKMVRGGFQLEAPLMYGRFGSSGMYSGFQTLDTTPQDTVKNGAWDWKQAYVNVAVDGLTLIKTDQPEAIADFVRLYFAQAEMELGQILGTSLFTTGSNSLDVDGLRLAVDDGTVNGVASYAGIDRTTSANSWWRSQVDSTTATLTLSAVRTLMGSATEGARHPTLIVSTQANYNRFWVLTTPVQRFPTEPVGTDEQLAKAGFTNLLFDNVPWSVDSNCPANHIFLLNEDYIYLGVSPRADFHLEDFQRALNQDAMVAKLLWAGNLLITNLARQGKFTAVTS